MKHTPGPWQIGGWPQIVATDARETIVCNVTGASSNEQAMADARLIAASPDLLAELQNIANAKPSTWDDPSEFRAWAQNRARAAIAKATGEP